MLTTWERATLVQLKHDEIDREHKEYGKATPYVSELRPILRKLEDA